MLTATALPAIEKALAPSASLLSLPPELESNYQRDRAATHLRITRRFLLCYLGGTLFGLLLDHQVGIPLFPLAVPLRIGVMIPMTLLSLWLLGRPLLPWVHALAAALPMVALTITVAVEARLIHQVEAPGLMLLPTAFIFGQTLTAPVLLRYTKRTLAAALFADLFLCLSPLPHHFQQPLPAVASSFICAAGLAALFERRRRECADRKDFLLSEANRLRMEDILRLNAHLERVSSIDGLTGVFNRRYLDVALQRLWDVAATHDRWISVLMVDIDHFKHLNDFAGHQHGDFCLREVARIIQHTVRAGVDTVARYGGEEFVAILPDANEAEVVMVGERIRQAIQDAGLTASPGAVVTVSAGAAAIRRHTHDPLALEEFVAAADQSLYEAKRRGRNRVVHSAALLLKD